MEHDSVHGQELVKCVLVGDTAVGKTRLICARACNARMSLRQLLTTHVPTVFAIDQYRMYKEVLERSMTIIDGVQVSLRLWDTFGDHDKDRRFAYGRSDIILLCFSIGNINSLHHCRTQWMPEIRNFCPDTPVLLVGCKNDLRFLFKDPGYLALCRDKSSFVRPIRESDLVMPEQARNLAAEFNLPYYETSVYSFHGVNQVFDNAIRSALIARRRERFWMTNLLKHVQQPLLQCPYCPPKRELNTIEIFSGTFWADIRRMLQGTRRDTFPDLVFVAGGQEIPAHRFILAATAPYIVQFFDLEEQLSSRRSSGDSSTSESTFDETEPLVSSSQHSRGCSGGNHLMLGISNSTYSEIMDRDPRLDFFENCPAIEDIRSKYSEESLGSICLIYLSSFVKADAVRGYLNLLYLGEFPQIMNTNLKDLLEAAEIFQFPEMTRYLEAFYLRDSKLITELRKSFRQNLKKELWRKCQQGYNTNVTFYLDDGNLTAHRSLLMARSEVFMAMFSGDFRERQSQSVSMPGVKKETFLFCLEYLYTDSLNSPIQLDIGVLVIELANRLCLPRLINLVENTLINDMAFKHSQGVDVTEDCIRILEASQLHNAKQLSEWCLIQLATNYDTVCRRHHKIFKELNTENRQWISQNRWPPIWYVKDFDYYQKSLIERFKNDNPEKKGRKRNNSGCLCFPVKSRKNETSKESFLK